MAKKKKMIDIIEYLSVADVSVEKAYIFENRQQKYLREYVRNKPYRIVGTMRRHGFSQRDVDRQWEEIVDKINKKQVQGVIVANMMTVARDVPDAYKKIGQIAAAKGVTIAVDGGEIILENLYWRDK